MQETYSSNNPNNPNNHYYQINLQDLFHILVQGKWTIIYVTSCISIIGVVYSLLLPNIYESKTLLAPVNQSSSISGALNSFSGLSSLGITMPSSSQGSESNAKKAVIKISSLSFFENNILPNIFLPDLMALKSWDSKTNRLIYDENIFNINSDNLTNGGFNLNKNIPSAQESFKEFIKHLSINQDINTGFITLKIKHKSPFIAKKWAELVIHEINSFYRLKDETESEKAVNYLSQQIAMTSLSEIRRVIAELLQEETQKLTLIEANQFYVFEFIDPPAVMEKKSEPKRALICILITIFGGIFSILLVLIKHYSFEESKNNNS
jgi:uncharacterized protein involved in exopolysaccharide biosynthesis